jgi:hypothetical protein
MPTSKLSAPGSTSANPLPLRSRGRWLYVGLIRPARDLLRAECVGFNEEQLQHGEAVISVWRYVTTSQFWFESMQNWQSEFIAVAAIVGLSIFLRQRGSAESKPVAEPHRHTSA